MLNEDKYYDPDACYRLQPPEKTVTAKRNSRDLSAKDCHKE